MQHGAGRGVPVNKLAVRGARVPAREARRHRWARGAAVVTTFVLGLLLAAAPFLGARTGSGRTGWLWATVTLLAAVGGGITLRRRIAPRPTEWLRLTGDEVLLQTGPRTESLIDLAQPIGVTLLANAARDRLLVAVTTRDRAAYFAATIDSAARSTHRDLLARANVLSDDEVLESPFADGAPVELTSGDLLTLVGVLAARDPKCLERCFLSDTRARSVILDGADLSIGSQRFDLHAPLTWRATVFQEPFGSAVLGENDAQPSSCGGVMVYQGTWLQQGMSEVVLVSLLASLTAATTPKEGASELASLLARDLRLMQAVPEDPPARELRVGIERVFMLRIRAAVDRAPRASKTDRPSGASMR